MDNEFTKADYDRGLVWFICILPLFGLFLEKYANGRLTGMLIWILIIVLIPLCCFFDCRNLEKKGTDISSIKKWIWLSPMYIYRREKLTGHEYLKALMTTIFIISAVMLNGFTQGLKVNEDYVVFVVKNSTFDNIDNYSGKLTGKIGDTLEKEYTDTEWECTKSGHVFTVEFTGTKDGKEQKVTFTVTHDGFVFLSFQISPSELNRLSFI